MACVRLHHSLVDQPVQRAFGRAAPVLRGVVGHLAGQEVHERVALDDPHSTRLRPPRPARVRPAIVVYIQLKRLERTLPGGPSDRPIFAFAGSTQPSPSIATQDVTVFSPCARLGGRDARLRSPAGGYDRRLRLAPEDLRCPERGGPEHPTPSFDEEVRPEAGLQKRGAEKPACPFGTRRRKASALPRRTR
jgi:hypothetical protein